MRVQQYKRKNAENAQTLTDISGIVYRSGYGTKQQKNRTMKNSARVLKAGNYMPNILRKKSIPRKI